MSFLPGTISLLDVIDKKHLMVLEDGRTLIGYLRSIDQFGNIVLQHTVERIHIGTNYGDIYRGVFLVRGENIQMLGEIDEKLEAEIEAKKIIQQIPIEIILMLQQQEHDKKALQLSEQKKALKDRAMYAEL